MKLIARRNIIISIFTISSIIIAPMTWAEEVQDANRSVFQFNGADYYFRWSDGKQYEFTPRGQSDLHKYSDMITIVARRQQTAENLAAWASEVVERYKRIGAILKTSSVPATPNKPAEHFIAAMLGGNGAVEGVFARFVLLDGVGYGLIYSRRSDGVGAGETVGKWVQANGTATEATLMRFAPILTVEALEKWKNAGPSTR